MRSQPMKKQTFKYIDTLYVLLDRLRQSACTIGAREELGRVEESITKTQIAAGRYNYPYPQIRGRNLYHQVTVTLNNLKESLKDTGIDISKLSRLTMWAIK